MKMIRHRIWAGIGVAENVYWDGGEKRCDSGLNFGNGVPDNTLARVLDRYLPLGEEREVPEVLFRFLTRTRRSAKWILRNMERPPVLVSKKWALMDFYDW